MRGIGNSLRGVTSAILFALLSACGGGGGGSSSNGTSPSATTPPGGVHLQIVSFGDSLSDVGTYAPLASAVGGGRFTTNPGQVWTQDIAQYYGDTLSAAFTIGIDHRLSAQSGLGYAEGGSTVATPANQYDFLSDVIGNVEMPVTQQLSNYVSAHGSFNANQLVLVWAGSNDVLRAGTPPAANTTVDQAASTLAQSVAQIVQDGATHVVVINVPNVGLSPKGIAEADHGANLTQLSQRFNTTLNAALQSNGLQGKVIEIDSYTWATQLIANYQANGFTVSNTAQACDPSKTPDDTSLLCSPPTYVTPNADQTYMFADDLHPTTHMHALFAQFVEQQIAKSGLGH
ncbi:Phosphatidylcholine-sterol acyltransferase [Paraburkholderia caffeinitolerans]|uniref:Phosphatidylcholine-sterol acyltransferase n=1 Tax=Paraburkholderia caffeinitolerans TaxID=1723730 RepID=A0A6J5FUQ2_9BURK|nr:MULTISPECIES: SGNH/GDSL hydrolase family protein [Paraburkholderia]CAB3787864.1 Phosphatidylcholine-sterol acyltransferase [Paraburkholderia caffeinitolerans]